MNQGSISFKFKLVMGSFLLILVVIIILQNTEVVPIYLLFWQITMSRSVAFLVMFLLGILVGFSSTWLFRAYRE